MFQNPASSTDGSAAPQPQILLAPVTFDLIPGFDLSYTQACEHRAPKSPDFMSDFLCISESEHNDQGAESTEDWNFPNLEQQWWDWNVPPSLVASEAATPESSSQPRSSLLAFSSELDHDLLSPYTPNTCSSGSETISKPSSPMPSTPAASKTNASTRSSSCCCLPSPSASSPSSPPSSSAGIQKQSRSRNQHHSTPIQLQTSPRATSPSSPQPDLQSQPLPLPRTKRQPNPSPNNPNQNRQILFVDNADKRAATRARNTLSARKYRMTKVKRFETLEAALRQAEQERDEWKGTALALQAVCARFVGSDQGRFDGVAGGARSGAQGGCADDSR